ncbi:MAG: PadR family transcriptional regulator [Paracholeplasma sp.]|jgi:PadR family transcriptional regulator PadR|uniref:Transcriptional regulator, PadR n=1 Tax=Acholeplasma brassicae TaxID=61635 RepID=U4KQ11_9MOLU|nr:MULTISPECIES: PadR family transcriptional regulator [Paracholeplasma]MDY3195834.1 PadR family transcriptional regulator [Paracholeplasma sp.]CCV66607.1 Transcriptional regulator, PadR [Paracholeplasma brassicae]
MDAQLKKGFLEVLVLSAMKEEPSYGYKIITDLSNLIDISESTLYPILKRLEQQKYLTTYQEQHQSRLRKYYRITDLGMAVINAAYKDFKEIETIYKYILR